jgi:hypothetical protein
MAEERWLPLVGLSVSQLPELGSGPGAYRFRDARTKEILYIGSTRCLRSRLLGNYLGGVGGATTHRVNDLLFAQGKVHAVEVRVHPTLDYRGAERALKAQYADAHEGRLPPWVRR